VVADGRAVAATRMYTRFSEIWEGWTKNIYLGLSDDPRLAWLGVFGALLCFLGALGLPGWVLAGLAWLQAAAAQWPPWWFCKQHRHLYLFYWRLRPRVECAFRLATPSPSRWAR
jgi:hypothetical protein